MASEELFPYASGDVLMLLDPLQELDVGLYTVVTYMDDWASLRWLIDDHENDMLIPLDRLSTVPVKLLAMFMPVGINMSGAH